MKPDNLMGWLAKAEDKRKPTIHFALDPLPATFAD